MVYVSLTPQPSPIPAGTTVGSVTSAFSTSSVADLADSENPLFISISQSLTIPDLINNYKDALIPFIKELSNGGLTEEQCSHVLIGLNDFVSKRIAAKQNVSLLPIHFKTLEGALIKLVEGQQSARTAAPNNSTAPATCTSANVVYFAAANGPTTHTSEQNCFITDDQLRCFTLALTSDEVGNAPAYRKGGRENLTRDFKKLISLDLNLLEWEITRSCIEYQVEKRGMVAPVLNKHESPGSGLIQVFESGRKVGNYEKLLSVFDKHLKELQTETYTCIPFLSKNSTTLQYYLPTSIDGFCQLVETGKATEELSSAFLSNIKSHSQGNYAVDHDINSMITFIKQMGSLKDDPQPTPTLLNTLFKSGEKLADHKKGGRIYCYEEPKRTLEAELCKVIRKLKPQGISEEGIKSTFFAYVYATISLDKIPRDLFPEEMGELYAVMGAKGKDLKIYSNVTGKYSHVRDTLPEEFKVLLNAKADKSLIQLYMDATHSYSSSIRLSILSEFATLVMEGANRDEIISYMNSTRDTAPSGETISTVIPGKKLDTNIATKFEEAVGQIRERTGRATATNAVIA